MQFLIKNARSVIATDFTSQSLGLNLLHGAKLTAYKTARAYICSQRLKVSDFSLSYHMLSIVAPVKLTVLFNRPLLLMNYNLLGNAFVRDFTILEEGRYQLFYANNYERELEFKAGRHEHFQISIPPDYLEELIKDQQTVCDIFTAFAGSMKGLIQTIPFRINKPIRNIIMGMMNDRQSSLKLFYIPKVVELLKLYQQDYPRQKKTIDKGEAIALIALAKYIEDHLDEPLNYSDLARIFITNEWRLKRDFKKYYNMTLYHFILEKRMVKAMHLVTETEQSFSDIGRQVGYKETAAFNHAFKKFFRQTPTFFKGKKN